MLGNALPSNEDRITLIRTQDVDEEIYNYLSSKFDNLKIEILGDSEGKLIDLMKSGFLEQFSFETTETAVLFLDDEDVIERGNIRLSNNQLYFHSWIVFDYNGREYVFDPSINVVCLKTIYDIILETEVIGSITARDVREYFIKYYQSRQGTSSGDEVVMYDIDDPSAAMYRSGVGYTAKLENQRIRKLTAHYYNN